MWKNTVQLLVFVFSKRQGPGIIASPCIKNDRRNIRGQITDVELSSVPYLAGVFKEFYERFSYVAPMRIHHGHIGPATFTHNYSSNTKLQQKYTRKSDRNVHIKATPSRLFRETLLGFYTSIYHPKIIVL